MLSSLPHYSIMMACGVCRTPFALIASAFSPPRFLARTSSRLSSAYSPSFSSKPIPYSFPPSFDSPFPPSLLSTFLFHVLRYLSSAFHEERERERDTSPSVEMHTRTFRSSSSAENVFVGPSIPGSSTRTHRRDDDVRDITPAGERESPKVRRGGRAGERRGEKKRKAR